MKDKTTKKRIKSTITYMDDLSNNYSKLNIVRVDLAYKKPYSDDVTLEDANKDFKHLLDNMSSKPKIFEHVVGYVCKREYTEDRGVHFHTMFICDGQKVKNDAYKADQIGKYWEQITKGDGSYHNCNRNKYEQNGIGMLDHKDKEKRKILDEKVIPYLCKEEQSIEPIKSSNRTKAFSRGVVKIKESKKGRPRKP